MENESSQKRCPKCGKENPYDARYCNACSCVLPNIRHDVKISKAAIASCVCALFALGCFVPGLVAAMEPRSFDPRSDVMNFVACMNFLAGGIAVLLGFIARQRPGHTKIKNWRARFAPPIKPTCRAAFAKL